MNNKSLDSVIKLVRELRHSATACPWTQSQTFESLIPQTIEEAYELADAIESQDVAAIKSELSDMLYHLIFYAELAEENGLFTLKDIADATLEKHHRRMPSTEIRQKLSPEEVNEYWQKKKAKEKPSQESSLSGIAKNLPAMTQAIKIQDRAARVGFDWPTIAPIFEKITEEITELQHELAINASTETVQMELGDIFFACANLARKLKIDPESALRQCNKKFVRRFQYIETALHQQGKEIEHTPLEELEVLWEESKRKE